MQALRFYGSFNVVVAGITIVNSSQCHLKFDSCQGVMVHDVTISSPENSLNTDGIHWAKQIKLYLQGGLGLVQDVRFSNIQVSEVQTPIIIDQFYLFRDNSYWSTTQACPNIPLPPKQPFLLASFWGALHSNSPSNCLLAPWKTCWEQLTVISRLMLIYTKVPSSIDWCLSMNGRETSDPFAPLLGGVHIYSYSDAIVTIARVTLQLKKR